MDITIIHPNLIAAEPDLSESLTARVASLNLEARELAANMEVHRLMHQILLAEVARLDRLTRSQSTTIQLLRSELRRYVLAQMDPAA